MCIDVDWVELSNQSKCMKKERYSLKVIGKKANIKIKVIEKEVKLKFSFKAFFFAYKIMTW